MLFTQREDSQHIFHGKKFLKFLFELREANLSLHDDAGNGEFGFTHPWFVVTLGSNHRGTFVFFKDQKVQ